MPDLQSLQKRWLTLYKILMRTMLLSFILFLCTVFHHDSVSPTAPDEVSGHIYPRYDKIHSRYVYIDKAAKNSESNFIWFLATFFICNLLVYLRLKRLQAGHPTPPTDLG